KGRRPAARLAVGRRTAGAMRPHAGIRQFLRSADVIAMDLELNDTQRSARETARRFAREAIAELGRLGMMGVFIPQQYGGAGLDHVSYALVIEELAVECASTAVI